MKELSDRLRAWAENEEMIDASFTAHGDDCKKAADAIEKLIALLNGEPVRFPTDPDRWVGYFGSAEGGDD